LFDGLPLDFDHLLVSGNALSRDKIKENESGTQGGMAGKAIQGNLIVFPFMVNDIEK
jgi:hypothetical protein